MQESFFEGTLPEGFVYRENFISHDEETDLLHKINKLPFTNFEMFGKKAKRRVVSYGYHYNFDSKTLSPGENLLDFIIPLKDRVADFCNTKATAIVEVLFSEYSPGSAIGWHRDVAPFGLVAGISLASSCIFKMRKGKVRNWETLSFMLEPRSAYILDGEARYIWQHSILPTKGLRYSITFRTLKRN